MLRFTPHGLWEMVIGTVILAALAVGLAFVWWPLMLLPLVVWIWLLAFFRDPERTVPDLQHIMVSPADGKVTDIQELDHVETLGGPAVRIGIFLSIFNVHVNRAPCDGVVTAVQYKKGRFINAMSHHRASEENESNTVVLADASDGQPIAVIRQIVGLVARRIICSVGPGDAVQRGGRIGMIKFGSRTELFIPQALKPQVRVAIGQKVRGAVDVLAELGNPVHQAGSAASGDETFPVEQRPQAEAPSE